MPLPLPNLDNRTYTDLLEEARSLIPSEYAPWTDQNPTDPGIVLLELFSWLTEMVLYRVDQVTDDNIETFLQLLNGPDWEREGTLDATIQQTILDLRKRYRAVSVDDFEQLVLEDWNQSKEASALGDAGKVARVKCLPYSNLKPCLSFDGVDDYVACDTDLGELSELTLEIWIKAEEAHQADYTTVVEFQQSALQIMFWYGNYRFFAAPLDYAFTGQSVIAGEWQHLAVTFNNTQGLQLYTDGENTNNQSQQTGQGIAYACQKIFLGTSGFDTGTKCFQGLLADFRLWDYARSGDEIRANMNRRLTGREDGLLVYLPLDEAAETTVFDRTPNGHHGIVNGASWVHSESLPLLSSKQQNSAVDLYIVPERVTWESKVQAVLEFNENYVSLPPESFSANASFTISFWVYGDELLGSTEENARVIYASHIDNLILTIYLPSTGQQCYFELNNETLSKDISEEIYKGTWVHWAFIKDVITGKMCIYLNGNLWHSKDSLSNVETTITTFSIGKRPGYKWDYKGKISEMRIWNRARNANEIQADMYRCLTGYEDGLVGYWPLDEGEGEIIYDRTPNGNHGTVDGEANWVAPDEVDTPMLDLPLPFPTTALKQSLWTFLDQRRLLTTRHHIVGPTYVSVPITATLHLKAGTVADTVCAQAINNIRRFFDPLLGGAEGTGWPFGRAVYRSEVYEVLDQVPGVDYVENVVLRGNTEVAHVPLQPHELVNVIIDKASLTVS